MSKHSEQAVKLYYEGYSCAQSMLLTFSDETGLSRELSLRISSSFGGGMGRLREVCGAVTGMFMICGILYGYTDITDTSLKAAHYARVQELGLEFKKRYSTFICRELLDLDVLHDDPTPEERTSEYYKKRKCSLYIEAAAEILDEFIERQKNK